MEQEDVAKRRAENRRAWNVAVLHVGWDVERSLAAVANDTT